MLAVVQRALKRATREVVMPTMDEEKFNVTFNATIFLDNHKSNHDTSNGLHFHYRKGH